MLPLQCLLDLRHLGQLSFQGISCRLSEERKLKHTDTICRTLDIGGFLYQRVDTNSSEDETMTLYASSLDFRGQKLT